MTKRIKTKRTLSKRLKNKKILGVEHCSSNNLIIRLSGGEKLEIGADGIYVGFAGTLPVLDAFT